MVPFVLLLLFFASSNISFLLFKLSFYVEDVVSLLIKSEISWAGTWNK